MQYISQHDQPNPLIGLLGLYTVRVNKMRISMQVCAFDMCVLYDELNFNTLIHRSTKCIMTSQQTSSSPAAFGPNFDIVCVPEIISTAAG